MINQGDLLQGVVEGVTSFGAFVKLPDGRKGLVHISEIAQGFVKEVTDYVQIGDSVTVKLIGEDADGKLKLSIRQANPPRMSQEEFNDVLGQFLKQSEERQLDVKRNIRKKSKSARRK